MRRCALGQECGHAQKCSSKKIDLHDSSLVVIVRSKEISDVGTDRELGRLLQMWSRVSGARQNLPR
jgi:hypothetical protein